MGKCYLKMLLTMVSGYIRAYVNASSCKKKTLNVIVLKKGTMKLDKVEDFSASCAVKTR